MVKGLLRKLANSFISVYATMAWYPAEMNMHAFVIQQPQVVHDMAIKRALSVFILNCLQLLISMAEHQLDLTFALKMKIPLNSFALMDLV